MDKRNIRLIQALCNQCNVVYKDIYIDYNNPCGEDVVYIKGEFSGYVEDFWQTWDNLRRESYED